MNSYYEFDDDAEDEDDKIKIADTDFLYNYIDTDEQIEFGSEYNISFDALLGKWVKYTDITPTYDNEAYWLKMSRFGSLFEY